jgi:2-methylcitrate dehydratase PrpD
MPAKPIYKSANLYSLNRRKFLYKSSASIAAILLPSIDSYAANDLTGRLASYMANARNLELPPNVLQDAKFRILDTFAAMISGSKLIPGEMATRFARTQGGTPEASILASNIKTTAINAAMINAMLAHSDESDDFEPVTKAHPGSATVPAALAFAQKEHRSGTDLIRGVALGYDVGCRFLMALGPDHVRGTHRGAEAYNATMGAMASAASLAHLTEQQMRYAISYGAQQVSGLWSWVDDHDHVEKSFDFSGMGARNGATAVAMVQQGLTGVKDVLDGKHNLIIALSTQPNPEALVADLGSRFFITESSIKTFPVGYPNQAPLDAFLKLYRANNITPDKVSKIVVRLPEDAIGIVGRSPMPDVNCPYLISTALLEGTISFANAHSQERMKDPAVRAQMEKVTVIGDPALNDPLAPRGGIVEVYLTDGTVLKQHTRFPPGTKENPLSAETVSAKARDLMNPVLGKTKTESIITQVLELEKMKDVNQLVALMITK